MTNDLSKTKPFLEGKRILLRPLSRRDINETYLSWLNDPEVNRFNSHAIFPYSKEELIEYVTCSSQDLSKVILAICDKKMRRHIGNVTLQCIDWIARSAEFSILIGDIKFWKKGIGTEIGHCIFEYGFNKLNLNRIYCGTSSDNAAMCRLALKLGMKQEGRRRQAAFKNGRYVDIFEYGALRADRQEKTARRPEKTP